MQTKEKKGICFLFAGLVSCFLVNAIVYPLYALKVALSCSCRTIFLRVDLILAAVFLKEEVNSWSFVDFMPEHWISPLPLSI